MTEPRWHGQARAGAGRHIAALEEENDGLAHNLRAACGWLLTLRAEATHLEALLENEQREHAKPRSARVEGESDAK